MENPKLEKLRAHPRAKEILIATLYGCLGDTDPTHAHIRLGAGAITDRAATSADADKLHGILPPVPGSALERCLKDGAKELQTVMGDTAAMAGLPLALSSKISNAWSYLCLARGELLQEHRNGTASGSPTEFSGLIARLRANADELGAGTFPEGSGGPSALKDLFYMADYLEDLQAKRATGRAPAPADPDAPTGLLSPLQRAAGYLLELGGIASSLPAGARGKTLIQATGEAITEAINAEKREHEHEPEQPTPRDPLPAERLNACLVDLATVANGLRATAGEIDGAGGASGAFLRSWAQSLDRIYALLRGTIPPAATPAPEPGLMAASAAGVLVGALGVVKELRLCLEDWDGPHPTEAKSLALDLHSRLRIAHERAEQQEAAAILEPAAHGPEWFTMPAKSADLIARTLEVAAGILHKLQEGQDPEEKVVKALAGTENNLRLCLETLRRHEIPPATLPAPAATAEPEPVRTYHRESTLAGIQVNLSHLATRLMHVSRKMTAAQAHERATVDDTAGNLREIRDTLAKVDPKWSTEGLRLVHLERDRQITAEGFTAEHDKMHSAALLLRAGLCYLTQAHGQLDTSGRWRAPHEDTPATWPWAPEWWKPAPTSLRNLEKGAALVVAALDRSLQPPPPPERPAATPGALVDLVPCRLNRHEGVMDLVSGLWAHVPPLCRLDHSQLAKDLPLPRVVDEGGLGGFPWIRPREEDAVSF